MDPTRQSPDTDRFKDNSYEREAREPEAMRASRCKTAAFNHFPISHCIMGQALSWHLQVRLRTRIGYNGPVGNLDSGGLEI